MDKSWYRDSAGDSWYYLNLLTDSIQIGWQEINGSWHCLNPVAPAPTRDRDASQNRWVYRHHVGRPHGPMYTNEVAPNGYHVDTLGAWTHKTP